MGFCVVEGLQIELDWFNFDVLNILLEYFVWQEYDIFFMVCVEGDLCLLYVLWIYILLVQICVMQVIGVLICVIVLGWVYCMDMDQIYVLMFYQVEGLVFGKDILMVNLKWMFEEFCCVFFEVDEVELCFCVSYFLFIEFLVEVDICCLWEGGKLIIGQGNLWLEILGLGMVYFKVLVVGGIDFD